MERYKIKSDQYRELLKGSDFEEMFEDLSFKLISNGLLQELQGIKPTKPFKHLYVTFDHGNESLTFRAEVDFDDMPMAKQATRFAMKYPNGGFIEQQVSYKGGRNLRDQINLITADLESKEWVILPVLQATDQTKTLVYETFFGSDFGINEESVARYRREFGSSLNVRVIETAGTAEKFRLQIEEDLDELVKDFNKDFKEKAEKSFFTALKRAAEKFESAKPKLVDLSTINKTAQLELGKRLGVEFAKRSLFVGTVQLFTGITVSPFAYTGGKMLLRLAKKYALPTEQITFDMTNLTMDNFDQLKPRKFNKRLIKLDGSKVNKEKLNKDLNFQREFVNDMRSIGIAVDSKHNNIDKIMEHFETRLTNAVTNNYAKEFKRIKESIRKDSDAFLADYHYFKKLEKEFG